MLSSLENNQMYSDEQAVGNDDSTQLQLQAMLHARSVIVRADSERLIWLGLRRPLRAGTRTDFKVGDSVKLYMLDPRIREKKWRGISRLIGLLTHHLMVGGGTRVSKFPKFRATL